MTFDVDEQTSATYEGQLADDDGIPVSVDALLTLTLTLYDELTRAPINGRDAQDVLDTNGVTLTDLGELGVGTLTWQLAPADTAVLDQTLGYERHVALFTYTFTDGSATRTRRHEVIFRVRNLRRVA